MKAQKMDWAYGVTTVPERRYNYLPQTLDSLRQAGFPKPTLFVDGPTGEYDSLGLDVVRRSSKILAYGNWLLAALELWIRYPHVHRYAIFQDDFVTYKNLRDYLDYCCLPDGVYWNLYTFPQNESLRDKSKDFGWYPSNQLGRGAVALVFNNHVMYNLLANPTTLAKVKAKHNPHRSIDGAIVTALANINIKEYVHYPTLIQHIGDCSSIGNRQHVKPDSFLGEDFDCRDFLHTLVS